MQDNTVSDSKLPPARTAGLLVYDIFTYTRHGYYPAPDATFY